MLETSKIGDGINMNQNLKLKNGYVLKVFDPSHIKPMGYTRPEMKQYGTG